MADASDFMPYASIRPSSSRLRSVRQRLANGNALYFADAADPPRPSVENLAATLQLS